MAKHDDIVDSIKYAAIVAAGLNVVDDKIVDQDTNQAFTIKGKQVKYANDKSAVTLHKDEILFNPIDDPRQAKHLLGIYLDKEETENGIYTITQSEIPDGDKTKVELRTNDGTYTSEAYQNNSMKYLDMMFRLNEESKNIFDGIRELDNDYIQKKEEEEKAKSKRKRKTQPVKKSFFE